MAERTLIIGDVHGCSEELRALLERCERRSEDRVVFVGDLVAKGPDSRGVLDMVRRLEALAVRGNHDQAVLACREPSASARPPSVEHLSLARTLDADDWALLEALPFYFELPEHDCLVVHAGLLPGVPLAAQDPADLMNMRSIRADGSASRRVDDGVPWASCWKGPPTVVFGHDARRGLQSYPYALGLDTGCVYGGRLTAWSLPERELISVPARRAYRDPGR